MKYCYLIGQTLFVSLIVAGAFFPELALAAEGAASGAGSAGQAAAPSFGDAFGRLVPLIVMVTVVYYLFVISPQKKEIKAQNALIEGLKQGDQVLTASGILGRVAGIEKDYILLEIAANTKVKFQPDQIRKKL